MDYNPKCKGDSDMKWFRKFAQDVAEVTAFLLVLALGCVSIGAIVWAVKWVLNTLEVF